MGMLFGSAFSSATAHNMLECESRRIHCLRPRAKAPSLILECLSVGSILFNFRSVRILEGVFVFFQRA
jgi:hypothetical protein